MRWNHLLTVGAAVSAMALMAAGAYAQSAAPAWTTATDAVRRGMDKLGKVVGAG